MDQTATAAHPRSRGLSFRSDKSGGSKTSSNKPKVDLTETPKDKERRDSIWKNSSKANPNAALGEAQPVERATLEKSTLESLRDTVHKDNSGNVIAEPDLSNPTRPRWERPLDTIRSFEKSIDSGYRRKSSMRQESYDQSNQYQSSRRNSYFEGPSPNRYNQPHNGSYYGSRSPGPEGAYGGPNPRQRYGSRMQSDSNVRYAGHNPQHGYHGSHDTVNTGGSDSTGPWANSTDPSSENSSLDRVNAAMKPHDPQAASNGFASPTHQFQGPILEESSGSYGAYPQQQNGYGRPNVGGPVQQPNGGAAPRRPIPLGNSPSSPMPSAGGSLPTTARPEANEKKKGWLKRRFSKNT